MGSVSQTDCLMKMEDGKYYVIFNMRQQEELNALGKSGKVTYGWSNRG